MSVILSCEDAYRKFETSPQSVHFIDVSFCMPGTRDPRVEVFTHHRLPNAVYLDIDLIANQNTNLPHMLPTAENFTHFMHQHGIQRDDVLIFYAQEHTAMAACRGWWMAKVFGYGQAFVMDGGLKQYMADGLPMHENVEDQTEINLPSAPESPIFYQDLVVSLEDILDSLGDQNLAITDARSRDRFNGIASEPRSTLVSGHIPHSFNLPFSEFFEGSGLFVSEERRLELVNSIVRFSKGRPLVMSCGSGVTACVLALALHDHGHEGVAVYDGSWCEYGDSSNQCPVSNIEP